MPSLDEIHAALAAGQKRTALRDLARLLKDEPKNLEAWLLLGQNVDDPQRKADCYRKALELDPDNPLAKQGMEWLYLQPKLEIELPSGKKGQAEGETIEEITEVLEPLGEPPAPAPSRKWLRIVLPIVAALLLAGLGLGIWAGVSSRRPAVSTSSEGTPSAATISPVTTGTPVPGVTTATRGRTPAVVATADPIFTSSDIRFFYALDTELWQWQRGRSALLVDTSLSIDDLQINADGTLAAFQSMEGLWVISLTGEDPSREVANPLMLPSEDLPAAGLQRKLHSYAWLPGSHILVIDTYWVEPSGAIRPANDLISVDVDNGELELLLPVDEGGSPAPSPDGSRLALVTFDQLQIYDLQSGEVTATFLFAESLTPEGASFQPEPVWAADSGSLVISVPSPDALNKRTAPTQLWRIPADGSQSTLLGEVYPLGGGVLPAPDLQHVAYTLGEGAPLQHIGELHLAAMDGSDDTILLDGEAGEIIAWAGDGSGILIRLADNPGTLWRVNVSTLQASELMTALPKDAVITRLQWLTDEFFLLEVVTPEETQLWLVSQRTKVNPFLVISVPGAGADIPFSH